MSQPKPTIDDALIREIAELARLPLSDDDVARYRSHMQQLLGYVDRLQECDVAGVPVRVHPLGRTLDLCADEPAPALPRDELLAQAPEADGAFFLVPKVIEQDE